MNIYQDQEKTFRILYINEYLPADMNTIMPCAISDVVGFSLAKDLGITQSSLLFTVFTFSCHQSFLSFICKGEYSIWLPLCYSSFEMVGSAYTIHLCASQYRVIDCMYSNSYKLKLLV